MTGGKWMFRWRDGKHPTWRSDEGWIEARKWRQLIYSTASRKGWLWEQRWTAAWHSGVWVNGGLSGKLWSRGKVKYTKEKWTGLGFWERGRKGQRNGLRRELSSVKRRENGFPILLWHFWAFLKGKENGSWSKQDVFRFLNLYQLQLRWIYIFKPDGGLGAFSR